MAETDLHEHLAGGVTTVARAWSVTMADGSTLGFTDHDQTLTFDGISFQAQTGLTARALTQATGLSVDNTEAMGALSDTAIREEDIAAGRYDGAEVTSWLVNWADVSQRKILFRGHIGEIRRGEGAFHAELRGLTDGLNRPVGRVFQKPCTAVLGDAACQFDLSSGGYRHEGPCVSSEDGRVFGFTDLSAFEAGWFQRGRLEVRSGAATGLAGMIKRDLQEGGGLRLIELWEPLRAEILPGDEILLHAGCDKRFETCRLKFNNLINFQGFPDIPEEDWITVQPQSAATKSGGSRR